MAPHERNRSATELLKRLKAWSFRFGAAAGDRKSSLLHRLSRIDLLRATELTSYHDTLCFMRAYPDNPRLLRSVEKELGSFGERVNQYKNQTRDKQGTRLLNSGMVNTTTVHPFEYDLTGMLMKWYPGMIEVDWYRSDRDAESKFGDMLPLVVAWQENDILDNDDDFDVLEWMETAEGRKSRSQLKTIFRLLAGSGLPPEVQRHFYDSMSLAIVWNLADSQASRTLRRVPSRRIYYQRQPLRPRTQDLRRELTQPPSSLRLLPRRQGVAMVRAVNEVLAVRNRELFSLTFANPSEVYIVEPGRGLKLALYGTSPTIRLPLESNYGALFIRNGIPVGYGIAATLFDRVEIAINIFPAFRSGESSFVIEQFFRVFYHHFGSRVFVVRKEQMGHGEEEALHSGSFWFYYKLGFRAMNPRIRRLAERENEKMRRRPTYRCPLSVMQRLANTDVCFHIDADDRDDWRELSLVKLGYLMTRYFAEKFDGDRDRGISRSVSVIADILQIRDMGKWSPDEITALRRLAPLMANIPDLARWTGKEKKALVQIIRSKGAARERRFVLLSIRHPRFKKALDDLTRG